MSVTVKEVLGLAAANAGRGDLDDTALSSASNADTAELLRCYNTVENEVALDFYPVARSQIFKPVGGKVAVTAFERQPVNILRVTDGKGRRLPFSQSAEYVGVEGEEVEIEYTYAPAQKSVGDKSEFGDKISARLLSYGTAAVYLLSRGCPAEAGEWERRYREALRAAGICRRTLSVRARRWV